MKPCQVMVVDDDAAVLSMLSRLLTAWGYEVRPFTQFEEARACLADTPMDALVVDVRLGKYNGLQLIHLAKQHHPDLAAFAVSGYDDPVLRSAAAEAGAEYFLKPLELLRLREHLPAA
jgi:DNA-binding NtrC family response regulator